MANLQEFKYIRRMEVYSKLCLNKGTSVFHGWRSQHNQYRPILPVIPVFPLIGVFPYVTTTAAVYYVIHLLLEIEDHRRKIKGDPLPLAADMGQSNIHHPQQLFSIFFWKHLTQCRIASSPAKNMTILSSKELLHWNANSW